MKLFIIGNGFDSHHGLLTNYSNYKEYLRTHNPTLLHEIESFPFLKTCENTDDIWSDLETTLSFNYKAFYDEYFAEEVENGYPDLLSDSDSTWDEIRIDIDSKTQFIYDFTGKVFWAWLKQIDIKSIKPDLSLNLNPNDLYITFNYTATLEDIYCIPASQILHIHGAISDIDSEDVLGMSLYNSAKNLEKAEITEPISVYTIDHHTVHQIIQFGSIYNNSEEIENHLKKEYQSDDFYGASIKPAIDRVIQFCNAASKNLKKNYNILRKFIDTIDITEVIIMGHSFEGIDSDYYKDILIPKFHSCKWTIYWYSPVDKQNALKFIEKYSIKEYDLTHW